MKKKKTLVMAAAHLVMAALAILLLAGAVGFQNAGPGADDANSVSRMRVSIDGGPEQEIRLPCRIPTPAPRTSVTLTASITPQYYDVVYIRSMYAPARIYLDGKLAYEFGKDENYPRFMIDPGTEVHMVETWGDNVPMELRMEFLSPVSQDHLTVHPPLLGTTKEVIMERFHTLGGSFVLSMVEMIYGISLILISFCILFMDQKGVSFFWLGLLSLLAGAWAFGENDFTGIIFKNTTLLYLLAFGGFFLFIIPLLQFTRAVVDFEDPGPVWYMELLLAILAVTALAMQLLGLMACSESRYFFYLALPLTLVALTVLTAREYIRYHNASAGRFILPLGALALTGVLEVIFCTISVSYRPSSISQVGILFFLLVMGVTASISVKDSIDLKNKERELDFEKGLMAIRIKEQESHSMLLTQHEQILSQQRHDMRHHLAALLALSSGENKELRGYLQSLIDNIPRAEKTFCENRAVNAIVAHYDEICRQKGIDLTLELAVPGENPSLHDSELCVIFGNLLENAVEACDRMTQGEKFIRLRTALQYDLLTILMDNSFTGELKKENGRFRSSKRNDFGIGITSIASVARKAGGDAEFQGENGIFHASVYVKL